MSTSRTLLVLSKTTRATRIPSRRFATIAEGTPNSSYLAERQAVKEHAEHTTNLWRRISFYVCVPATFVCIAWVRNVEGEHAAHLEHITEENGGVLPEQPEYDYMNKRAKPFPWGLNTLFYNPHSNKNMEEETSEE